MKKDAESSTSQDYDRKHQKDHIAQNPRAAKDLPDKGAEKRDAYHEDKRQSARHEHTNHFTNRAGKHSSD